MIPNIANAYELPDLPYPFEALEPYIDAPTMKIHHDKHHGTYVAGINKWSEGKEQVPIVDLMAGALEAGGPPRNSGGGHYNHAFFWTEMAPPDEAKKTKPSKQLEDLINKSFGSMDEMKSQFEARAAPAALFGSGWVWVCVNQKGDELKLVGTPNQDNPLMKGALDEGIMFPILGLDVWEHAYYLKYQNRRPEYVSNWWVVGNWRIWLNECIWWCSLLTTLFIVIGGTLSIGTRSRRIVPMSLRTMPVFPFKVRSRRTKRKRVSVE